MRYRPVAAERVAELPSARPISADTAATAIVASPNSRTIRRAAAPTPGPARRYPADSTGCTAAGCSAMLIGQRSSG